MTPNLCLFCSQQYGGNGVARTYKFRRWAVAEADPAACLDLAGRLGVTPVTAQILYNRGFTTPEAARAFLHCDQEGLHDPFLLRDMDRASALLQRHAAARDPILVYGDYDVDGVTGTAILVQALRHLGARVDYYIPNRFAEGYGLNAAAVRQAAADGYACILSVDTGISALAEAELARELGLTMVVTDHHEPGPELPRADAVVNPGRRDCPYPFKGLAGAGVAFKLVQALAGNDSALLEELLDIVAVATLADMVPLVGENRWLVRAGLQRLAVTRRPGLAALKQVAGIEPGRTMTAGHVGFALGPRLNALGRMGDARAGVELLLTPDPDRALAIAQHLDAENRNRQEVEAAVLTEASAQWESQPPAEKEFCTVLAGSGWHHGVVGICASRVVERHYRPAVLLAIEGDEARGSARSIPGFHLYQALAQCQDLLIKFGGHAMAAGMTLRTADIPALRARLNRLAREWLADDDLVPRLTVDAYVQPEQVTPDLVAELARLEPYGIGNPAPLLACSDLALVESRPVGKEGQHLKARLAATDGQMYDAIGWGLAAAAVPGDAPGTGPADAPPAVGSRVQVAFVPEMNEWNGRSRLQLVLSDLRPAATATDISAADMAQALQVWDPLAGLEGEEATPVPAPWPALALPAPRPEGDPPTRLSGVAALAARGPVLVLVNSPWALAPLARSLQAVLRPQGGAVRLWLPGHPCPAPAPGQPEVVLAAWGTLPVAAGDRRFHTAVAWHPPFLLTQAAAATALAGGVAAAWQPHDLELAGVLLGWPYPGRTELVHLYRMLRQQVQPVSSADLAARLVGSGQEPMGPWNLLRVRAGAAILEELRLLTGVAADRLQIVPAPGGQHGKMKLEDSPRHWRGLVGRNALRRCLTWGGTCATPEP